MWLRALDPVFQSRAGFSSRLDKSPPFETNSSVSSFNPVLGFLAVSTRHMVDVHHINGVFQSRAGFSSRLDLVVGFGRRAAILRFNPVLGFLAVSTRLRRIDRACHYRFNPVLGFLAVSTNRSRLRCGATEFQSRAGFSSRLDNDWINVSS